MRLRAINRYPGPPFTSADNLIAQVFASAVIDALVKAATPDRQTSSTLPSRIRLFISCVIDEFGDYCDALRRGLTRPNVEVITEEDFRALGGDTLKMVQEYIEQCEAVVHFVGDMAGPSPAAISIDDLLKRGPYLEANLAAKGLGRDALKSLTYTQWEAWLAVGLDKDLLIVQPAEGAARGRNFAPTEDSRAAQAQHLKRLRAIGRYPGPPFTSADNLIAQVFASAVIDALVKGAALSGPRNLPLASLGELFVGRDKALDELRAALTNAKGAAVAARALHGLGGVGKTRLAIEYAWRHAEDHSALLFVRAEDAEALGANIAALAGAEVLDLPEKEARDDAAKIEAVLRWLEAHPTWLMILDNVNDEAARDAVTKLMPRLKGGHVIITARAANFPASIRTLELDVLDEDAATQFLLERTDGDRETAKDDEARARALARELGGLALGLEQAGAYIAAERIGFVRYLALWHEKREIVLKWFDRTTMSYDHDVGLATTWAASVEKLTPESRLLLDRLVMLAPEPIPDSLLDVAVPGEAFGYDAFEARRGLYAYSLVTRARTEDGVAGSFVVHRLVQDFARRAMTADRRRQALQEALTWIDAAFVGDPQDVQSWPVLDPLAAHALAVASLADSASVTEPTARLFNQLGLLFLAKARFAEAERLIRRAISIDEASFGPDYPQVALSLSNLAELLQATNRLDEAEPLYRRALGIDEARYGPGHPNIARDLNSLALLFLATNRLAEAEPLFRRALAVFEKSFGPDHPRVATSLNNLAELFRAQNRLVEAEPLYRRALSIDEMNFGSDHPNVARELNNLALVLVGATRLGEAEPLLRRALTIDEASYGPEHPTVAIRLSNLANLLQATNRASEAEPLLRRALANLEKSLGPDHPQTATVRDNLARLRQATPQ